jgi:hypothetical protein
MFLLFFFLSLLAIVVLCWGLITPKKFSKFISKRLIHKFNGASLQLSRTKIGTVFGCLALAFFVLSVATAPPRASKPSSASKNLSASNVAATTTTTTSTSACQKPSAPVSTQSEYANASQIVQVLVTHNVPCSHLITDTGISSFTGATSGVWVETAPGDSAAQFGGSANAGTDTEIVVFKSHADAVSYASIGNGDTTHQVILGTNWAIDAASSSAASIRAALGVTSSNSTSSNSSTTSNPSPKPTPTPAPAPTPQPTVLLDQSGSGIASTNSFTTSSKWSITYTFDCSSFDSQGNFQIYINNTDGSYNTDAGANDLALNGGNTDYYYDSGQHYLQVNSECDWHVTVKN